MVRAKFYVWAKTEFAGMQAVRIEMSPVYSQDAEHENKKFWEATPSGKLEMTVKPEVAALFEVGREYYIDFTASPRFFNQEA